MEAHCRDNVEIVIFTDGTSAWHKFGTDSTIVRLASVPGVPVTPKEKRRNTQLFELVRTEDVSGVSGTGVVAEIGCFSDGTCAMRWLTETASTAIYASLDDLERIHGHGGATRVRKYGSPRFTGRPGLVGHVNSGREDLSTSTKESR